ncbi:hypothetical protein GC194_11040 [bacterium]|nr:hypothetical protein [bacterium]
MDFQGSYGMLDIMEDDDKIYDSSTKMYMGKTTSGRTNIKYATYASANGLFIELNDEWFGISAIDGACDMVVNGIEYYYKAENSIEYLVLNITKELVLDNYQWLREKKGDSMNAEALAKQERKIYVLPNSALVFAIGRK